MLRYTSGLSFAFGASTPWKRIYCNRGRGEPTRVFLLAEVNGDGLVGLVEVQLAPRPVPATGAPEGARAAADPDQAADGAVAPQAMGAELVRLYVQPRWQGRSLGRHLPRAAEAAARLHGADRLWLTGWEGITRAHGFYEAQGYWRTGDTWHEIQGQRFANRVYARPLGGSA